MQLQVIDISSEFKVLQEHSVEASGGSKENISNTMITLWKRLEPTIEINSMTGSI